MYVTVPFLCFFVVVFFQVILLALYCIEQEMRHGKNREESEREQDIELGLKVTAALNV